MIVCGGRKTAAKSSKKSSRRQPEATITEGSEKEKATKSDTNARKYGAQRKIR